MSKDEVVTRMRYTQDEPPFQELQERACLAAVARTRKLKSVRWLDMAIWHDPETKTMKMVSTYTHSTD